jgi:WD40 repeat protein
VALVFEGSGVASSVVAVTGVGRVVRFELDGLLGGVRGGPSAPPDTLFYFHSGPVWALAVEKNTADGQSVTGKQASGKGAMFASGGDDRYINVWCSRRRVLLARARAAAPLRSLDLDGSNTFLAAGMAGGYISLFELQTKQTKPVGTRTAPAPFQRTATGAPAVDFALVSVLTRKDCQEDISDVRFSPNSRMLAVGSHDQCIDLYSTHFDTSPVPSAPVVGADKAPPPRAQLKHLRRLKGHTSFITHLDWSADNRLLRTCCASYELLYWDVGAGKQFLSAQDALEADTQWHTHTCTLGFPLMGIWPPNADGSDVNAVDVLCSRGLVATADDSGYLSVMNYPCVAKHAPRRVYGGHSSHVMNVKFMPGTSGGGGAAGGGTVFGRMPSTSTSTLDGSPDRVVTVGGNDNSVQVWRVVQASSNSSYGSGRR